MTRTQDRMEAEQTALRLLAQEPGWCCPTRLAERYGENWRVVARALCRLAGKGIIAERRVEYSRPKGRTGVRREYRLRVNEPMLILMPKFDPSKLNIVGARVVRFE